MPDPIVRTNGSDFSSLTKIVLINPDGYQVNPNGSLGPLLVNTKNQTDYSSLTILIRVDQNGNAA